MGENTKNPPAGQPGHVDPQKPAGDGPAKGSPIGDGPKEETGRGEQDTGAGKPSQR